MTGGILLYLLVGLLLLGPEVPVERALLNSLADVARFDALFSLQVSKRAADF